MTDFLNSNDGTMHKVPLVNRQCLPVRSVELIVYVILPWQQKYSTFTASALTLDPGYDASDQTIPFTAPAPAPHIQSAGSS